MLSKPPTQPVQSVQSPARPMTPSDVLRDPDFHALSEIERLKVLYKIDPDYRKMHPKERWKVVNMIPKPPNVSSDPGVEKGNGVAG